MSINQNSLMVVIEKNHPHFDLIKKRFNVKSMDEAIASYETYEYVLDFTILKTEKKGLFLKELAKTTRAHIISDLTCTFQEKVFHLIPQVKGSISSYFYSPTETIEFYFRENLDPKLKIELSKLIDDFMGLINLKTRESKVLEFTFTMPRVVSQIINEAYYALEENLATPNDIDQAMLFGVNYPLGPITWGHKTGLKNVLHLLEEIFQETKDSRYKPSMKLKKECL
jgi:3-hydroxybutyryl-CoA dehydrogenase